MAKVMETEDGGAREMEDDGGARVMEMEGDGGARVMEMEDGGVRVMEMEDGGAREMEDGGGRAMEEGAIVPGFQHTDPVWSVVSVWPTYRTT